MDVKVKEVTPVVEPTYEVTLSGLTRADMEILASVGCRTVCWDDGAAGKLMEQLYYAVNRGTGGKRFPATWGSCVDGSGYTFDMLRSFRHYGR